MDDDLLRELIYAGAYLNPGNSMSPEVLSAIAKHLSDKPIQHSAETGAGGSTLLFSHASQRHVVFAIEGEERILSRLRSNSLLRGSAVEFVTGPTQINLPKHTFNEPLQAVLIDGPHAFPFPQLEYFYLYPHLSAGALLIVDDIHIPSIHDLFSFLCADKMFDLIEVVGRTAFFRRTAAETFDPFGDGWQLQSYNRSLRWRYTLRERVREALPECARNVVRTAREKWRERSAGFSIELIEPKAGASVGPYFDAAGRVQLPESAHLWVFLKRDTEAGWWPQHQEVPREFDGSWQHPCRLEDPAHAGHQFDLAVVAVDKTDHARILRHLDDCERAQLWTSIPLPDAVRGSRPVRTTITRR